MRRYKRNDWITTVLVTGLCLVPICAGAQDGTWTPVQASNNFDLGANWTPNGVPTGTAFFGPATPASLLISQFHSLGGFTFNANAPSYAFNFLNQGGNLTFTGAGVINNSANTVFFEPTFNTPVITFRNASSAGTNTSYFLGNGVINFFDTSNAGSATFNGNGGSIYFHNSSSANNAIFSTQFGSSYSFLDTSTAGNATFTAQAASPTKIDFYNSSNGGSATFNLTKGAVLSFHDTSSAQNATINFNPPQSVTVQFLDSSNAGNATIAVTGLGNLLSFGGNSSAANATLINNGGGVSFSGASTGGNATINSSGTFDISGLTTAGMTAGSIAGTGSFFLGSKQLTVGSNNLSTEVGGVIADGGFAFGTGGSLVKTGTGTLILSGNNTYTGGTTINGGVLQLGNGGTAGSILGNVIDNATLAFNRSDAVTFGGVISGTGTLQQNGTGSTTLTAIDSYIGPTTVNAGTLLVNGSIAASSLLTVNAGATIGGNGILPSTIINGTLSPGNSIGLITINGTLVLGAGAIYKVEVSPTNADRTAVTGAATLGGTVQVVPLTTIPTRTTYTILSAASLTGTFASVSLANNFARNASLSYAGGNVLLTLDPGSIVSILPGSATANQRSVAGAIDSLFLAGGAVPGGNTLFLLSPTALGAALDQLSGEVHASTVSVLADESLYVRSAILGRLRQASYGDGTMAALRLGGPQAFASDGRELMSRLPNPPPQAGEGTERLRQALDAMEGTLSYAKSPIVTKAPPKPQATSDVVFWAQGFGAWGRFSSDGNAAAVRRDLAGFISGVDTRVGGSGRVGFAAGYTGSQNNLDGRGSANVDTGHIAAYGGLNVGGFNLRGGAAYAFHTIATDRTITFPGFFDRAFANYEGNTAQVFGEAGYGFALTNIAVEPFAGAAWVRVHTDSGAERAMTAGLNFASANFEVGYSTLGIRAASLVPLWNGMVMIPRALVAWQHAFSSVAPTDVLAFQTAPTIPFTIAGVPIARDAALVEAGLDLAINARATVGVAYTGQLASNVSDHAAKGKFTWKF